MATENKSYMETEDNNIEMNRVGTNDMTATKICFGYEEALELTGMHITHVDIT